MRALQAQHAEMASAARTGASRPDAGPGGQPRQRGRRRPQRLLARGQGDGTFIRDDRKVGRNEPCPCGSGKKFKHCHGALTSVE